MAKCVVEIACKARQLIYFFYITHLLGHARYWLYHVLYQSQEIKVEFHYI